MRAPGQSSQHCWTQYGQFEKQMINIDIAEPEI